jgi:hypothetical protein
VQLPDVTDLDPLESKLPKMEADAMDFLKSTLRYEPGARATCEELLAHPFFEGFEEWFMPVSTWTEWVCAYMCVCVYVCVHVCMCACRCV